MFNDLFSKSGRYGRKSRCVKKALGLLRAARKLAAWNDPLRTDERSLDNKLAGCHPGSPAVPHKADVEPWNASPEPQPCRVYK